MEQQKLREMGIEARVQQICLSTPYPGISYKWRDKTHVYTTLRKGNEEAYGLSKLIRCAAELPWIKFHVFGGYDWYPATDNVCIHGEVSDTEFNGSIKNYHACLRLNEFDGFGDALAKSCLMGQWPISAIAYPHVTHAPNIKTLVSALQALKDKKEPNHEGRKYWLKELSKPLV